MSTGQCRAGLRAGGAGVVHLGYELGSGLGFGVTAGVLTMTQEVTGRPTSLTPLGLSPDSGTGPIVEVHQARFFYVTPELRVGLPLSRRVELNLGLSVPVLVSISPPRWGLASGHPVSAGSDRSGTFPRDPLVGQVLLVFAPGVGARYDF